MMRYSVLLVSILFCISGCTEKNHALFLIRENGRYGYINSSGKTIIPTIFYAASDFSEGLAAVRADGTYGCIDSTGQFIIPAQFDYATSFHEGFAVAWINGRPMYIDSKGKRLIEPDVAQADPFEGGRALIKTRTRKYGMINRKGQLIADTVFDYIGTFLEGLAVVRKDTGSTTSWLVGIMDTDGHMVIPFGKYDEIGPLSGDRFRVYNTKMLTPDTWESSTGFIDKKGQLYGVYRETDSFRIGGDMNCGMVKFRRRKYLDPKDHYQYIDYEGFLNRDGKIVTADIMYSQVYDFNGNRSFVKDSSDDIFLVGRDGQRIGRDTFSSISENGFSNGKDAVACHDRWGIIDSNGHFIVRPQFDAIILLPGNDFFLFIKAVPDSVDASGRLLGLARSDGTVLLPASLQQADYTGFHNGLLRCYIHNRLCYINQQGKTVWQESKGKSKTAAALNIDYMARGDFYAFSAPEPGRSRGYYQSDNLPKKIGAADLFNADGLQVVVRPSVIDTLYEQDSSAYLVMGVYVVNNSGILQEFDAQDSRLPMKIQARDAAGQWRDISYLPSSWCGNSYHKLGLQDGYYWAMNTPAYSGAFKTKLRIALEYTDPDDKRQDIAYWKMRHKTIYSNEYDGGINPAQFWREEGYFPNNIMDPYYN